MEIRVTPVMPRRFRAHANFVNYGSPNFSDFVLRALGFIACILDSHPNLSLHFSSFRMFLHVSITFHILRTSFWHVLHFHMFITMLNICMYYADYCFNTVSAFHKHLSRTSRVKSIGSGVKEQLTILDQVVN